MLGCQRLRDGVPLEAVRARQRPARGDGIGAGRPPAPASSWVNSRAAPRPATLSLAARPPPLPVSGPRTDARVRICAPARAVAEWEPLLPAIPQPARERARAPRRQRGAEAGSGGLSQAAYSGGLRRPNRGRAVMSRNGAAWWRTCHPLRRAPPHSGETNGARSGPGPIDASSAPSRGVIANRAAARKKA